MNIKLIYDMNENETSIHFVKTKLEDHGHNVVGNDGIISYEGRKMDAGALLKIEKRDPRNSLMPVLRKQLMLMNFDKVRECDCVVLVCNNIQEVYNMLVEIAFAYALEKSIFVYTKALAIPKDFANILNTLNVYFCEEDMSRVKGIEKQKEIISILKESSLSETMPPPSETKKKIRRLTLQ